MSFKSKKNKKKKWNNKKAKKNETHLEREVHEYGSIKLERQDKVVAITSNLSSEEQVDFTENLKNSRPKIKQKIENDIERLLQISREFDNLNILAPISITSLMHSSEEQNDSTNEVGDSNLEYLLSLFLAQPYPDLAKKPTPEIIDECINLLESIKRNVSIYYGSEFTEKGDQGIETDIRFKLLTEALYVRGDAYNIHSRKTFIDLCSKHDNFLLDNFGFTTNDFLNLIEYATQLTVNNINKQRKKFLDWFLDYQEFLVWCNENNQDVTQEGSFEEFKNSHTKLFLGYEDNLEQLTNYFTDFGGYELFRVEPKTIIEEKILLAISTEFGKNNIFTDGIPKAKGWPLNPSIIYEKPVIKHQNKFYLFHAPLALRNSTYIIENLIQDKNKAYFENSFLKSRDKYLENTGLELFKKLLPSCQSYSNLYYILKENGQNKRAELDALIIYDDTLLLIEAKAGKLNDSARRGSIPKLKNNLSDIVTKAHQQGVRALNYIKSQAEAKFLDERNNEMLTIKYSSFENIFIINISFEQLSSLTAHIISLQKLGLITGKDWPWSVYLNDLRAIADIIKHPTLFLHFLKRRILLNEHPSIKFSDELDIFMFYLKEGLFFQENEMENNSIFVIHGYTEELDSYYVDIEGKRGKYPKPEQKMPTVFERLITKLESSKPNNFVSACNALLDCDGKARQSIDKQIRRCEREYFKDKEPHTLNFCFQDSDSILLLAAINFSEDIANHAKIWSNQWLGKRYINQKVINVDKVIIIYWQPPLAVGKLKVFIFKKS